LDAMGLPFNNRDQVPGPVMLLPMLVMVKVPSASGVQFAERDRTGVDDVGARVTTSGAFEKGFRVDVTVWVGVAVSFAITVKVGVAVWVGVAVSFAVTVKVGVAVWVGAVVSLAIGVRVGVGVSVGKGA
jgi:hypothetical protein